MTDTTGGTRPDRPPSRTVLLALVAAQGAIVAASIAAVLVGLAQRGSIPAGELLAAAPAGATAAAAWSATVGASAWVVAHHNGSLVVFSLSAAVLCVLMGATFTLAGPAASDGNALGAWLVVAPLGAAVSVVAAKVVMICRPARPERTTRT